jgi:hypothetical protein
MSSFLHLHERTLQRALQPVLADPSRTWTCTDGTEIQIVAAGLRNPHPGPDFRDMAVLHAGRITIGTGEVHKRSSEWHAHGHDADPLYDHVLVHVVLVDDRPVPRVRWTLVMSDDDVRRGLDELHRVHDVPLPLDELQHHALLRLMRTTAEAQAHARRLGLLGAAEAMACNWIERIKGRRRRPLDDHRWATLRTGFRASALCAFVEQVAEIDDADVLSAIDRCLRTRIHLEGDVVRHELFTNAILPTVLGAVTPERRAILLQWYWSAESACPYNALYRRFPALPQRYVWQQQGMLEFLRLRGTRQGVCADIAASYGMPAALDFVGIFAPHEDDTRDRSFRRNGSRAAGSIRSRPDTPRDRGRSLTDPC